MKTKMQIISQNHRMVGVGRDLCGSSSPTPLPKQGHRRKLSDWSGFFVTNQAELLNACFIKST